MALKAGGLQRSRTGIRHTRIAQRLPEDDYHPVLDQISDALAGLPDPGLLTAAETTSTLHRLQQLDNQLDAYRDHLAAAADDAGYAKDLHAGTTGTLTGIASNQDSATGAAAVRRGQWLKRYPIIDAAYTAGTISRAHVELLRRDADRIDYFEVIEADLVTIAENTEPADLAHILTQLVAASAPETGDQDYERARRRRALQTTGLPGGELHIRARLDPVNAAISWMRWHQD